MMRPAKRYSIFVADLLAEPAGLCKPQMVWVTRLAAADKAGVASHKAQVLFVSQPFGFGQGEHAFVDAGTGLVWSYQVRLV